MRLLKSILRRAYRAATFGLGRRLSFLFGTLIAVFVAAALLNNLIIQLELVSDRREMRAAHLGKLAVEVSLPYLVELRPAELDIIYEELYGQPDVDYIYFLDEAGVELVNGGSNASSSFLTIVEDPLAERARASDRTETRREGAVEHYAVPIRIGTEYFGTVRFGLLVAPFDHEIDTVWRRNLLLGALFGIGGILWAVVVGRRVSKPLKALTRATEEAALGNLDQVIELKSNDELEVLARSFSIMLDKLQTNMREVHTLAYVDGLTGLPNRVWFTEYLGLMLEETRRKDRHLALMFLDLDNFKRTNDTFGHHMGDRLLSGFADRLRDRLKASGRSLPGADLDRPERSVRAGFDAVVARLGGDEFTIILPDIALTEEAELIAESIVEAMVAPFSLDRREIRTSTSVGVALFPCHAETQPDLLKLADIAMYQAKEAGRNTYRFFDANIHQIEAQRTLLERELHLAVEKDQFELYFQPQFDVRSGQMSGAETLVRWRHPERGLLNPGDFLPVAEQIGLMPQIGRLILRRTLVSMAQIPQMQRRRQCIAVNVSVDEVENPGFAAWLRDVVKETGFDPRLLELEITENTAMSDNEAFGAQLRKLRGMGISFAVDDFGMGYSNLDRLKRLEFQTLKIDKSLLDGIGSDPHAESLLSTIMDMALALHLDVVAEGIETPDQWAFLKASRCTSAQGFLMARPMPFDRFKAWLDGPETEFQLGEPAPYQAHG